MELNSPAATEGILLSSARWRSPASPTRGTSLWQRRGDNAGSNPAHSIPGEWSSLGKIRRLGRRDRGSNPLSPTCGTGTLMAELERHLPSEQAYRGSNPCEGVVAEFGYLDNRRKTPPPSRNVGNSEPCGRSGAASRERGYAPSTKPLPC